MDLHKTDPEFAERFEYFAFQEVPNEEGRQLPEKIPAAATSIRAVIMPVCMIPHSVFFRGFPDNLGVWTNQRHIAPLLQLFLSGSI